jgi:hypothetical protein
MKLLGGNLWVTEGVAEASQRGVEASFMWPLRLWIEELELECGEAPAVNPGVRN